jgi:hypothetical protein
MKNQQHVEGLTDVSILADQASAGTVEPGTTDIDVDGSGAAAALTENVSGLVDSATVEKAATTESTDTVANDSTATSSVELPVDYIDETTNAKIEVQNDDTGGGKGKAQAESAGDESGMMVDGAVSEVLHRSSPPPRRDTSFEGPDPYGLEAFATSGLTFKILRAAVCTQPILIEYFETPFELAPT